MRALTLLSSQLHPLLVQNNFLEVWKKVEVCEGITPPVLEE